MTRGPFAETAVWVHGSSMMECSLVLRCGMQRFAYAEPGGGWRGRSAPEESEGGREVAVALPSGEPGRGDGSARSVTSGAPRLSRKAARSFGGQRFVPCNRLGPCVSDGWSLLPQAQPRPS